MKTTKIKNKEGEVLKTKDNKEMTENWFEIDDEFIPVMNKVFERSRDVMVKDKMQKIVSYSIKAAVRSKNATGEYERVTIDGESEIFVRLTPTQAKSINSKIETGIEVNQHLWRVYGYDSKMYGPQIGVGLKGQFKPPKTFEDFDNVKFNDAVDLDAIEEEDFDPTED